MALSSIDSKDMLSTHAARCRIPAALIVVAREVQTYPWCAGHCGVLCETADKFVR